jgi:hypothetical protein
MVQCSGAVVVSGHFLVDRESEVWEGVRARGTVGREGVTTGAGGLAEALAVGFPRGQGVRGTSSESDTRPLVSFHSRDRRLASHESRVSRLRLQQSAPPGRRRRDRETAHATGFSCAMAFSVGGLVRAVGGIYGGN